MLMILLLLLCLTGYLSAKEPPDVDCVIINLEHMKCLWNQTGSPVVNYTFSSWYKYDKKPEDFCTNYLTEKGTRTGCIVPYLDRFKTFLTKLAQNESVVKEHEMKYRVLLNPPVNLTVKYGSDFNLWFYWNHTKKPHCVESEVRYRTNNNKWEKSDVRSEIQYFCINLPFNKSRYELQVRGRFGTDCGRSLFWSDWSEPVVWGANNSTNPIQKDGLTTVWNIVLYVMGPLTLLILVVILLYHERIRIIPMPVVPKPPTVLYDIEDWLRFPNVMKDNFKANYNEHACPVREYSHVSQSDSESSDGSTSSVTTNQTDCSVFIPVNQSEAPSSSSSSSSEDLGSSEEEQHPAA